MYHCRPDPHVPWNHEHHFRFVRAYSSYDAHVGIDDAEKEEDFVDVLVCCGWDVRFLSGSLSPVL